MGLFFFLGTGSMGSIFLKAYSAILSSSEFKEISSSALFYFNLSYCISSKDSFSISSEDSDSYS